MKRIMYLTYLSLFLTAGWSQTTGKLVGDVKDADGSSLVGANVIVLGTGSGASAGAEGDFTILNVPAGSYTVMATYIGYATQEITNVQVISGLSTELNFSLSTSSIEGEVVQVMAVKPLIQKDETSSVSTVSSQQLRNMPIRDLNSVLATIPGVVVQNDEVYIRGGRNNEVAYYLNGAGTTNLGDRSNLVYVPQEAVEELQVQVGGYDAEISGANSGVIKRTLKQGTSEYSGSFSLQNDGAGSGEGSFGDGYSYGHQTVLASVGGPLLPGSESLKFFGAVESSKEEDSFVKIANGFEFLDQQDERTDNSAYVDQFDLSWKDGTSPGRQDEYLNFTGSLSYDGGPLRANVGIVNNSGTTNNGGGIMSQLQWGGAMVNTQNDTGAFLNSFDVSPRFRTNEYANNMLVAELTYALSNNTILRANASSFKNEYEAKDNLLGTDWTLWGDSVAVQAKLGFSDTDVSEPVLNDDGDTTGYQTTSFGYTPFISRYVEKADYLINGMPVTRPGTMPGGYYKGAYEKTGFSASLQHVMGNHDIKAGVDYNKHTIRNYFANPTVMKFAQDAAGSYGYTTYGSFDSIPAWIWRPYIDGFGYDVNGSEIDARQEYTGTPAGQTGVDVSYLDGAKTPSEIGFYIQDKMEFDDIIVNVGLRIDQLDPSETAPARADSLTFYDVSKYVDPTSWDKIDPYTEIQPRIGISFPFTDKTNVYGYYGRFSQLVDLNSMYYTAYDYRTQMGVGGNFYNNPIGFGLEPVRTTQYEIGFKQQISNDAALKVTGFYKNQKGLIQADRVSSQTLAGDLDTPYNYVRNGDFATTKGVEFTLALRSSNGLTVDMNYTAGQAEGTGSGRSSYLAALDRGTQAPTMINPVDFNQTHSGSINLDYRLNGTQTFLDGLGSNLLFTFNSGHAFTYVYRPVGGQVSAFDAGVDYMDDTRSRQALEPVGASTTPWVYNLDLKLDKDFTFGNYGLKVFARVNNLLDRRNALNVYQATGSASDDGFYGNDVYSESFVDLYGDDPDGDGVTDYEEMYKAINIDNDESYRVATGDNLISAPRQVFIGFAINF